jgi:dolichol-phosphate mannosyltransferase
MPIDRRPLLSIVTPAYNEAENLLLLHQRLAAVLGTLNLDWEWIVVDDHSADGTFTVVEETATKDPRVRGIRFARNFGSHVAMTCGLDHVRGDCAVVMAADLQDPPETLPALLEQWRSGAQLVWAVRSRREEEKITKIGFARLYYFLLRRIVGLREMPVTGADFFLMDRRVVDALRQFKESNVSVLGLVTWMGYRQATITYDKRARLHGRSGWTLEKKLKLVVDSVAAFTYLPIRIMSYFGFLVAVLGFVYAAIVIINALTGNPAQGWSSLMVVVLLVGGIQMLMMGVLGEYLWRALEESRRRPRYLVEATTDPGPEALRKSPYA